MRREKQHRSISQKFQPIAQALFIQSAVLRSLRILDTRRSGLADGALLAARHEIPFVDQDNHRPSTLVRVAGNVGVEAARAFGGVHHEEHNVGVFNIFARHHHRKLLGHQVRLALAANAGRIHKADSAPVIADDFVNGIPRGARNRRDDGAVNPGELIQQR